MSLFVVLLSNQFLPCVLPSSHPGDGSSSNWSQCETAIVLQVASSTLDASAKIYAGRVDAIHSETYKVLTGLGRGSEKQDKGIETFQKRLSVQSPSCA